MKSFPRKDMDKTVLQYAQCCSHSCGLVQASEI